MSAPGTPTAKLLFVLTLVYFILLATALFHAQRHRYVRGAFVLWLIWLGFFISCVSYYLPYAGGPYGTEFSFYGMFTHTLGNMDWNFSAFIALHLLLSYLAVPVSLILSVKGMPVSILLTVSCITVFAILITMGISEIGAMLFLYASTTRGNVLILYVAARCAGTLVACIGVPVAILRGRRSGQTSRLYWIFLSTCCYLLPNCIAVSVYYIVIGEVTSFTIGSFVMMAGLLIAGIGLIYGIRNNARHPENACATCGYSLYGLPEPRCPECGSEFSIGNHISNPLTNSTEK